MLKSNVIANILNSGKSQAKGALGENLVLNGLRHYGVSCWITSHIGHCGDIRTKNGTKIEVKTATQSRKGEFRFCLQKNDKHGYTNYKCTDYVLLQAISNTGLISYYLIPTSEISGKHINLGTNSRKYATYQTTLKTLSEKIQ